MTTLPTWSEKIDERGFPVDPLNANRSRNRVRNLFAHGTITSITLRLRYASIFCWALDQLSERTENKYAQLKSVEKLFCLSSRYRQLQADHGGEALRVVPDLIDGAQLQTTGYVVHTLQTALHDALTAESAEDAIVTVVNRGGDTDTDTDTVGAVTGAIAGARFNDESLPERWLEVLEYREDLELLVRALATTDIDAPR